MAILKVPYNGEWAIIESPSAVKFTEQTLTDIEKAQARENIGVTNIEVDSVLSTTSTNPVQNKVINAAISELSQLVGDTEVSAQIADAVADKADADALDAKMNSSNPTGTGSFSMNRQPNTDIGEYSVAEGDRTESSGRGSHAEGIGTTASDLAAHAEGDGTTASGRYSHAEGSYAIASGLSSHAEGEWTVADGAYSHAEGQGTSASSDHQHVQGRFNVTDADEIYAHIVGNGQGTPSNAHTLDWNGNAWFAGDVYVGSTSGTNKDAGSVKLVTETELQSIMPKVTNISMPAANWVGSANPWSQVVTINGVTANSKVDLQPAAAQIVEMQDNDIALMAENNDGVVTVYAIGSKPAVDYTIQALITEVVAV